MLTIFTMTIIQRESLSVPHDLMLDEFIKENLILHQALLKPCQVSYKRLFIGYEPAGLTVHPLPE